MKPWFLLLFLPLVASAETRQEMDQQERDHMSPVMRGQVQGTRAEERGPGFYVGSSKQTSGLSYSNDIRWLFGCGDMTIAGEIPAKFKNVTWRIKGKAPSTNISKGIVQTDQEGVAFVHIQSNLKDLSSVMFELEIENQTRTMVTGEGPYKFQDLPLSVCKTPKS